ncbi:MAG: hydrolase, partial [Bacteroidota bacterium]
VFAYALLAHWGVKIPNFRSSDLWEDQAYTIKVSGDLEPLDLMLYHRRPEAFGAHVGLYWGEGMVLHLAKHNQFPKIEAHLDLLQQDRYTHFIGAKRVISPSSPRS